MKRRPRPSAATRGRVLANGRLYDRTKEVDVTRRVLAALAQVLPDDGCNHLTRLDFHHGWGDTLNVRLHTTMPPSEIGRELGAKLREAVDNALIGQRHTVDIVWDALG
jgi:hypothetical protein